MPLTIPQARRVEPERLLSVIAIPLAAALAMATAVMVTGAGGLPGENAAGPVGFVLEFIKLTYLAVAMAHLSGALAERLNGAMPAGLWFDDSDDERAPTPPEAFWSVFPNHIDGAALALSVTMLCLAFG